MPTPEPGSIMPRRTSLSLESKGVASVVDTNANVTRGYKALPTPSRLEIVYWVRRVHRHVLVYVAFFIVRQMRIRP